MPAGSTGEFYATNGQGGISQLAIHTNWRSSWTQIIPGNFGGNGFTDLLFYDAAANTGEFYTTNGRGGITLAEDLHRLALARGRQIVPGEFASETNCMVVHFKSLLPITHRDQQLHRRPDAPRCSSCSRAAASRVLRGTNEDLSGNPNLTALRTSTSEPVSSASPRRITRDLMANRNNAGATHVVVYLVSTLIGGGGNLLGCATHPDGQPGAAIVQASGATG